MDTDVFDRLARAAAHQRSRRGVLRLLLRSALGTAGLAFFDPTSAEANAFGCLNVGQHCFGHDTLCCSGRCAGKKPVLGRRDRRHCVAHDVGGCTEGQDDCAGTTIPCGTDGSCYRTTGDAGFCGRFLSLDCRVCARDADCVSLGFGKNAACIACAQFCPETGGTACGRAAT